MKPSYSKIWLVVAGTVAGMTVVLHAAYPDGRAPATITPIASDRPDPIAVAAPPWLDDEAIDASAGMWDVGPLIRPAPATVVAARPVDRTAGWIAARVNMSLWSHINISDRPGVHVLGSVVTLTGRAATLTEKNLATEYARGVDGVTEVLNRMTVAESAAPSGVADVAQPRSGSF